MLELIVLTAFIIIDALAFIGSLVVFGNEAAGVCFAFGITLFTVATAYKLGKENDHA